MQLYTPRWDSCPDAAERDPRDVNYAGMSQKYGVYPAPVSKCPHCGERYFQNQSLNERLGKPSAIPNHDRSALSAIRKEISP